MQLLVYVIALGAALGVIAGYGGPLIYGLDLVAHMRLQLVLMAMVAGCIAVIFWWRRALWLAVLAVTLGAAGLAPVWERGLPQANGTEVVVMTANLYHRNARPEGMRAALLAADADILVTHETTKAVLSGQTPLSQRYPYRLSLSTSGQILRTVIWSKFPMRGGRLFLEDRIEPTGAAAIVEIAPGLDLSVLGMHLAHPGIGSQDAQVAALPDIVRDLPEPRVVVGDFNATPWSMAMRRIETATGTRRIPGYRVTWTGRYPVLPIGIPAPLGQPIDHVLTSQTIGVRAVDILTVPGSDHKAVRARLVLPTP